VRVLEDVGSLWLPHIVYSNVKYDMLNRLQWDDYPLRSENPQTPHQVILHDLPIQQDRVSRHDTPILPKINEH
jgi:hypothetical protein